MCLNGNCGMRINSLNYGIYNDQVNLYTKRTCSDNSEMFITSKLNMLYEQALSDKNAFSNKRNLKKMLQSYDGSIFDQTI